MWHIGVKSIFLCNRAFSQTGDLKKHIKTVHEGIRYRCDKCNKDFSDENYLKKHIAAIHEGLSKHKCDICGKAFSQKGDLTKHINGGSHRNDIKCEFCKRKFKGLKCYQKHINTKHKNKAIKSEVMDADFIDTGEKSTSTSDTIIKSETMEIKEDPLGIE